ncbi:MAG: metallophosphoesterase family protein [Methyloceanibacter sp.]
MASVGIDVTPALPKGRLLYAVGDIHGRADLLDELLHKIEADAAKSGGTWTRTLVFLGDYVDRGPGSREVIEILLGGLPRGFDAHFLKGNHEAILLDLLADPSRLGHWLINGGDKTLASYGVDCSSLGLRAAEPEAWREAFAAALPDSHLRFLENLELSVACGDYLFVHAGVRPGIPLDRQDESDLVWIRYDFLDHTESFGKVVVHGHTPVSEPTIRPNRIGLDTGAFFSDRLTALRLQDGSQRFLQT